MSKNMNQKGFAPVLLIAVMAAVLFGAGIYVYRKISANPEAMEKVKIIQEGVKLTGDGFKVTKKGESSMEFGKELEKKVPDDIPLPDDADVGMVARDESKKATLYNLIKTAKPFAEVKNFYLKELPQKGWRDIAEAPVLPGSGMAILKAVKEGEQLIVQIQDGTVSGGAGSLINISRGF